MSTLQQHRSGWSSCAIWDPDVARDPKPQMPGPRKGGNAVLAGAPCAENTKNNRKKNNRKGGGHVLEKVRFFVFSRFLGG